MTTRKQKIEALQAIKDGRQTIGGLQPPQQYCFEEINESPGLYMMAGKVYDVDQYFNFCKGCNEADTIICITKHLPTQIKGNLTLNI